jgi:hypothetical protein
LCFAEHITEICKKAGRKLNVLKRLSKTLSVEEKFKIFQAFILSQFNYCPIVWHFCSISHMKKMEKIQERALRYVYNDFSSSYADLRTKADVPLLYVQRLRYLMTEVYKIINKQGPTYLHWLLKTKDSSYNTRNPNMLEQPKYNTVKYGLNSLKYQGARMWNLLDSEIKQCQDLLNFKFRLSKWQGPNCNCANCIPCTLKNI